MKQTTKKQLLSGALVVPVLSLTLLGSAQNSAHGGSRHFLDNFFSNHQAKDGVASQQVASGFDPRVLQLEEAVRELTRQVETLQLALSQMQKKLDDMLDDREANDSNQPTHMPSEGTNRISAATVHLTGNEKFDVQDNFLEEELEEGEELAHSDVDLPQTDNAREFYRLGYQYMLSGDYRMAERVFRAFQARFPDDEQIGDASFWLGEALYGQGRYREAAQVYIDVQRLHQDSPRSPENLLKLGMSMAQLQETDVACKTLDEVPKRYTKTEPAVLKRVVDEKKRLHCP